MDYYKSLLSLQMSETNSYATTKNKNHRRAAETHEVSVLRIECGGPYLRNRRYAPH